MGSSCVAETQDAGEADTNTEADGSTRLDCTGMADGAVCGEALLCIDELCLDTRCGDAFVDEAAGEDCDDANEISGDGCEPGTCVFSCTQEGGAESCSDGDPCNGPEFCGVESHRCEAGEPAAETACELEGGTVGICSGGLCAPLGCGNGVREGAEVCDDGNDDQDDGCKSDCTYTCVEDIDCSDADACTGVESCEVATHTCIEAAVLECNDEDTCTADSCEPATGCVFTLIDADDDGYAEPDTCATAGLNGGDCEPLNGSIYPGALEQCDSIDNDCDDVTDEDPMDFECYEDIDSDGYGNPAVTINACMCPLGTVAPRADGNVDCDDRDSNVHEGQRTYFTTPHCNGCALDYDYDCDGVETMRYPSVARLCTPIPASLICSGSGWTGAIPSCGSAGAYRRCARSGSGCSTMTESRTQSCR